MFDWNANTTVDFIENLPDEQKAETVDQFIGANEAIIKSIDTDPKLKQQYQKDTKDVNTVAQMQQELFGVLYEQYMSSQYGAYDNKRQHKLLDNTRSRGVPYEALRRTSETEIPSLIINRRRLQLTEYAQPANAGKYGREVGFSLIPNNSTINFTKAQKKELKVWEERLVEKFFFPAGEVTPNLSKFLGSLYRDFFTVDDLTISIRRDGSHYPIGCDLQDPALWYYTIPEVTNYPRHDDWMLENAEVEIPEYEFIMRKGGKDLSAATRDYLIKSHFFVRSDYYRWKRGYSVMEQAIRVTAIILNAIIYNASNFSNNRTPAGVLALTGGYTNQLQIEKLKKILWATMSGAANQRRLPIVGLPEKGDAKWVSFHANNREMEFYTGLTFFTSIICSLSGTDPNELGLANFRDAIRKSTLNEESRDGVIRKSEDTGLMTFLNHVENTLNIPMTSGLTIWEEITKMPVKVEFKGLVSEDLKAKIELNDQRLKVDTSVNQLLAEDGKDKAKYEIEVGEEKINIYDIVGVSNPQVFQLLQGDIGRKIQEIQQQQQLEMQQQMAQQGGMEGEGEEAELTDRDRELIEEYGEPE